ncbi:MAG: folate family ECF transporter S component [Oscillospiraceae bacterium]|nr:folate family ECF transporter S component [Oscillospiraceae bacterium]
MRKNEIRSLVMAALLAALDIVTTRTLFAQAFMPPGTFEVRVSLQFLWYGLAGWLLGPGWAIGSAVSGDLIGSMMNAGGTGTFFPGYTLTALVSGLACGMLLYKRQPRLWRALLASGAYCLLITLPLTSLWRSMTGEGVAAVSFETAFWVALPWRAALVAPYGLILAGVQKALDRPFGKLFL